MALTRLRIGISTSTDDPDTEDTEPLPEDEETQNGSIPTRENPPAHENLDAGDIAYMKAYDIS